MLHSFVQDLLVSKDYPVELSTEFQDVISRLGQYTLTKARLVDLFQQVVVLISKVLGAEGSDYWQVSSNGQEIRRIASTQKVFKSVAISTQDSTDLNYFLNASAPSALSTGLVEPKQACPKILCPDCAHGSAYLLSGQNTPFGILTIYSHKPRKLTAQEDHFLELVVRLLVTAIKHKRSEALLNAQSKILEQIASGAELSNTLENLCFLLEQELPGAFCSILLRDEKSNTLHSGVGPSLPQSYAEALNGLVIGEKAGSCGTAAYRGEAVFVNDIASDPLWISFRDFALSHNIRACWSIPFCSKSGDVLGTFAISHQIPCQPNDGHIQIMKTAIHLASIATRNHQTSECLRQQAYYDSLTGLANRNLFTKQLKSLLKQRLNRRNSISTQAKEFAVLFVDVDRFKLINDSLGHTVGDQFLQALTQRLKSCIGSQNLFARLGGDEFGILLPHVQDAEQADRVADCLQAALIEPLKVGNHEIMSSVSIGIVCSDDTYSQMRDVLRDVDQAMHQAKLDPQRSCVVFSQAMHNSAITRLQTEQNLRSAIEQLRKGTPHPFQLYYQPIVSLKTGRISGFEALIRWIHDDLGLIQPERFISIAEETGLIVALGDWVIEEACQQLQQWQMKLGASEPLSISVNISPRQFFQPDLVLQIQDTLKRYQLAPESIKLEITESLLLETSSTITDHLHQLRKIGIQLSLDDFGTGYSSLRYLNDFPVNTLKIDRSFVQSFKRREGKIIQAIVGLAQNLGMTVIAEGIETLEQANYLKDIDCDQGQGYLYSYPLPREAAEKILLSQLGNSCKP